MADIIIKTNRPHLWNELGEVAKVFFPGAQIYLEDVDSGGNIIAPLIITHEQVETPDAFIDTCGLFSGGMLVHSESTSQDKPKALKVSGTGMYDTKTHSLLHKRHEKRAAKLCVYTLLKKYSKTKPPWGALTGVRPTRLFYERLEEGLTVNSAKNYIIANFDVGATRAELLSDVVMAQEGYIRTADDRTLDIYIGIPFCTSRCAYCSFGSEEISGRAGPYLEALLHEIEACAKMALEAGYGLRAMYIGGGTPTSLTIAQLERLLDLAARFFPGVLEFTVEAGRPDTIDREKLKLLKDYGVNRISINPQTFHDETLKRIGREHTSAQTHEAMLLAREAGFDAINMDIIAGLPGETYEMFEETLAQAMKYHPENLTVHTLAVKRAAKLRQEAESGTYISADVREVERMVMEARNIAAKHGMVPYYLYRQKYMAGNLENVGYCLPGAQCVYNIDIMEETTSILAFGAGAISKRVFGGSRRIERAANIKDVSLYTARIDDMIERKRWLFV